MTLHRDALPCDRCGAGCHERHGDAADAQSSRRSAADLSFVSVDPRYEHEETPLPRERRSVLEAFEAEFETHRPMLPPSAAAARDIAEALRWKEWRRKRWDAVRECRELRLAALAVVLLHPRAFTRAGGWESGVDAEFVAWRLRALGFGVYGTYVIWNDVAELRRRGEVEPTWHRTEGDP